MSPPRAATDHRTRVGRERSARTERRILEAALRVFAERGPDAPVIDEFVAAAEIARGTFYNHFESVEELLFATSAWSTCEVLQAIEDAMRGIEGPTLRLGVGLRVFFARAMRDPVWSRFVARVWRIGGMELPTRDLVAGIKLGHFRVPGRDAAVDLLFGGIREALHRIGEGGVPSAFGDQMTELCLQALRAEPRRIAAALAHELPELAAPVGGAPRATRTRGEGTPPPAAPLEGPAAQPRGPEAGGMVKGMGGGMDLVAGAKRVVVMMEHTRKNGRPKLLKRCALPLTGERCASAVCTDLAWIEVSDDGLRLQELAPGVVVAEVQRATEPRLLVDPACMEMDL